MTKKIKPHLSELKSGEAFQLHYPSPNKKKRETTINVSIVKYGRAKAKEIADKLLIKAFTLIDDPTILRGKPNKPGGKIKERCANDIIIQDYFAELILEYHNEIANIEPIKSTLINIDITKLTNQEIIDLDYEIASLSRQMIFELKNRKEAQKEIEIEVEVEVPKELVLDGNIIDQIKKQLCILSELINQL